MTRLIKKLPTKIMGIVNTDPHSFYEGSRCLLRCSLSAAHTSEQIKCVIEAFSNLRERSTVQKKIA